MHARSSPAVGRGGRAFIFRRNILFAHIISEERTFSAKCGKGISGKKEGKGEKEEEDGNYPDRESIRKHALNL